MLGYLETQAVVNRKAIDLPTQAFYAPQKYRGKKRGCELTGTGGGGAAYGGGGHSFNVLYGAFMQPAYYTTLI